MRSIPCFLVTLFVSFASLAQSAFPPSPKQLVAVNPVTNKVYIANEAANTITVLNGATNTTATIPVGSRPQFIVVNPLTNRIYVNNGGAASVSVIDGDTDTNLTPTPLPVGSQGPMAINAETNVVYIVRMTSVATDEVTFFNGNDNTWYTIATESFQPTALTIDPVTNKLYVAHYGTGDVRVISGAYDNTVLHPTTFSIGAWSKPFAIAANSNTNKIYVITEDSRGPIGIINGANNTADFPLPTAGHAAGPKALAVNPVTNRIYAAFAGEVVVIDGGTNAYTYIPVNTGSGPASIGINYLTNKIYVSNTAGLITVIDGQTNATTTLSAPMGVESLGVNAITNEIIATGPSTDIVPGVTGPSTVTPIVTTVMPLPGNSSSSSGSITMNASNGSANPLPIRGVYFQLDSMEGAWSKATGSGTGPYTAAFSGLPQGSHTLYAFAAEGRIAPTDTGPQSNPLFGNIVSYAFSVNGTKADATVSMLSSANPSNVGQPVTFTASVTGTASASPTGSVTFSDGATTLCSAVALSSGSAACAATTLAAGSHTITASYSGDSAYNTRSTTLTQTVNKLDANAALAGSPNPAASGQAVTLTATLTGSSGTPTGAVAFTEGTTTLAGCGAVALTAGKATCNISTLSPGNHTITATYSGNATYKTATATAIQSVGTASANVALTSSANPSLTNEPITFTANVTGGTGTATGTVNFTTGTTTLCSAVALSSGSATCSTSALPAGSNTITAGYSGSSSYAAGSANMTQAVNKRAASVLLGATPNPATSGDAVKLTATLSGAGGVPTGSVDFVEGTTTISGCSAIAVTSGAASCTTSSLAPGNHSIVAKYSGNATYNAGQSSPATVTVNACTTCPPPPPSPVAPSGTIATQQPTYSWAASPGATSYYLLVQNTQGVAVGVSLTASGLGCASGGTCTVTPASSLTNNTTYNWFVNASNANGTSAWSDPKEIRVSVVGGPSGPPAAPTQLSPSGTVNTATPTYTWNAATGATSYQFLVQNTQGVAVSVNLSASAAGCASSATCSFTPSNALVNDTTYNWFVSAANAQGTSAWSNGLTITVKAAGANGPPAVPSLIAPEGTVNTTTPAYSWNASAGATSYYLLVQNTQGVAVSMAIAPGSAGCAGGGTCSFTPANALANGVTYAWYVNASNNFGTSAWSDGKLVTPRTAAPSVPAAPTTVSPTGNIGTRSPTYTWNASSGTTSYYLLVQNTQGVYVSQAVSPEAAGCGSGTGMCSLTPPVTLGAATSYAWYVNATNTVGTSAWSDGRMFTTP